jgi:chromosome partitioning protein
MPTIVIASSKGGSGKSTTAVLLLTQLAQKGADVTILDVDINRPISLWERLSKKAYGIPEEGKIPHITVKANITQDTIFDDIETAATKTPFVIVDLEGTANLAAGYAISRADFVIVPTQGSQLDAAQTTKTIGLIKQQGKLIGRKIPYAILFTRTSPALQPRTLKEIQKQFHNAGILAFQTQIHERDAFRAIFSFGGALETLDLKKVANPEAAIINARAFVGELIHMLKHTQSKPVEDRAEHALDQQHQKLEVAS